MKQLALRGLLAGALVLVFFAWGRATGASAAPVPTTWTYPCGGADNLDYATCERLNYIAGEISAVDDSTASAVSRLDLTWIGVWFTGGVAFGVVFGNKLWAETRKWHGGFR